MSIYLLFNSFNFLKVKGKPNERRGRKATGLRCFTMTAGVTKGEIQMKFLGLRLILCLVFTALMIDFFDDEIGDFFNTSQYGLLEKVFDDGAMYTIVILLVLALFMESNIQKKLKQSEDTYRFLANHDSLTGLPNRRLFKERLNQALETNHSDYIAVLFIDLDGFKHVNDTLGHEAGDLSLLAVSKRLKTCILDRDTLSRLAGDEFIILLPNINHENDAVLVAEKIIQQLHPLHIIKDSEIKITASIGIAFSEGAMSEPDSLIKRADKAMYQAKKRGKNNYQVYRTNQNII
jgi:diguanylate cyclase (GGDEF)-like protein